MKKARRRPRSFAFGIRNIILRIAALIIFCMLIHYAAPYADAALSGVADELFSSARRLENMKKTPALTALMLESPLFKMPEKTGEKPETAPAAISGETSDAEIAPPAPEPPPPPESEEPADGAAPPDFSADINEKAGTDDYLNAAEQITLKNYSSYEIDVKEALSSPLAFSAKDGAEVLIIHTHGSEAYTMDGDDVYEESDPYRTVDTSFNVVRAGDLLTEILTERGITVIHDRNLYDYPNYNGSYGRAYDAICAHIEEHPGIKAVIDLHRDAMENSDGTPYKSIADVGSSPCSQVMVLVGTDSTGLAHDGWRENLKFGLRLQAEMISQYPTLARPLKISQYRYNQHATPGSLIIEVGTNGNTLREALAAVTYFGDCLADVLSE